MVRPIPQSLVGCPIRNSVVDSVAELVAPLVRLRQLLAAVPRLELEAVVVVDPSPDW